MAITKEFKEAVENGKKTRVRIMLKDIMLIDPSLNSFDEMLSYAEKNLPGLYDEHNGEEFNNDSSSWDEDYMNEQMVSVVINFSRERIEILCRIVKKLYAHKIQSGKTEETIHDSNFSTKSSSSRGFTGMQIAGGIIAVAGAGALIGGIVKAAVPVAIVGGVAIAGGVAMVVAGSKTEE